MVKYQEYECIQNTIRRKIKVGTRLFLSYVRQPINRILTIVPRKGNEGVGSLSRNDIISDKKLSLLVFSIISEQISLNIIISSLPFVIVYILSNDTVTIRGDTTTGSISTKQNRDWVRF